MFIIFHFEYRTTRHSSWTDGRESRFTLFHLVSAIRVGGSNFPVFPLSGAAEPSPEDPAAASPEPAPDRRQTATELLRAEDADEAGASRRSAGNAILLT